MASFKWSITTGFQLRYKQGGAYAESATTAMPSASDDARPTGWAYVAQWGSDVSGNGSRKYPYRTIEFARTASGATNIVVGTGVYKEGYTPTAINIFGDGNVLIDTTYASAAVGASLFVYNITFFKGDGGYQSTGVYFGYNVVAINCAFRDVPSFTWNNNARPILGFCVFENAILEFTGDGGSCTIYNNTFINCKKLRFATTSSGIHTFNNIFYNSNLSIGSGQSRFYFNLFYQCNFLINTVDAATPTVIYPSLPTGYTYYNGATTLKIAMDSYYGAASGYRFQNNNIQNPLFNSLTRKDYSLQVGAGSMNMAHDGTFVGAFSFAKSKVPTTGDTSMIDSTVNLSVTSDGLEQTDNLLDSEVIFIPFLNVESREIRGFNIGFENAAGSGSYVDTTEDLDVTIISYGGSLEANQPYFVKKGTAVYNGDTYIAGQRFTANSTTSITLTIDDEVQKIIEAPSRWNLYARVSNGTLLSSGYTLVVGAWYHVRSGSITYDGITYNANEVFKASVSDGFTGTGQLVEIFTAETYHLFEINKKPTTNNTGNVLGGSIVRGNGHPDFDRTAANVFPLYYKYVQFRVQVKANNLRNI